MLMMSIRCLMGLVLRRSTLKLRVMLGMPLLRIQIMQLLLDHFII
jgi:hypothetical protein